LSEVLEARFEKPAVSHHLAAGDPRPRYPWQLKESPQ
jgi:hypothetical protein